MFLGKWQMPPRWICQMNVNRRRSQQVLMAQGDRWPSHTIILMNAFTVGALSGPWRERHTAPKCLSILPGVSGYHTGGVMWRVPLSHPLQHTYPEVVSSNLVTRTKIWAQKPIDRIKKWSHCSCQLFPLTSLQYNMLCVTEIITFFSLLNLKKAVRVNYILSCHSVPTHAHKPSLD